MTAPTLAVTVEAVARAIFLANPLSNKSMVDAGWDLYEKEAQAAVTATLAALEPLASAWSLSAWKHASLGDLAAERGDMTSAEREWAQRDTYAENAKQLRAIIAATGEKS